MSDLMQYNVTPWKTTTRKWLTMFDWPNSTFLIDMDANELEKDEEGFSYAAMQKRDRRRWAVADQDGDDELSREEFAAFLHPEETGHMREVVVLETMEDIDKDKDGRVSLQEYIGKYLVPLIQ